MSTTISRLLLFLLIFTGANATAQPDGLFGGGVPAAATREVKASLASGSTAIVPGQPLEVALKLEHPEHWHTYWLNPGVGLPTTLKWDLPEGWKTSPLVWPVPQIKPSELGNQHIYEGTIYLLATVTPPDNLPPGSDFTLKGSAKWLVCDEDATCNPGGAELSLTLPVSTSAEPIPAVQQEFEKVRSVQPQTVPQWKVELEPRWSILLTPGEGANPDPGNIYFFDRTQNVTTDPPVITREGPAYRLTLKPSEDVQDQAPAGFVHAPNGWLADGSVAALAVGPPDGTAQGSVPSGGSGTTAKAGDAGSTGNGEFSGFSGKTKISFMVALGSLFLAGMILNLMPCVFPVLALKVLSFARQAGKDAAYTRRHSLAYTMGLLIFVWLVAGGMFVAKTAFNLEFAWGDLTRYAGPMAVVVIVLFLLGLNLAGLFEIGTGLGDVGSGLQDKSGYAGSFWSGALTMLISTPCSGPFMAVAMGYALQQTAFNQFLLFTSFGLGIAAPYVVLSSSPALLKKLPRPGAWMETFKKALAFPMFAATIYFYNTFAAKTGADGASLLLWGLLFLALAAWIYGHWCVPSRKSGTRVTGGLVALLMVAGGSWFSVHASREKPEVGVAGAPVYKTGDLTWLRWSPETLAAERAKGRAVFVNYTTLGCITCDTNEQRVFKSPLTGSDKVIAKFKELNVAPLRAKYLADGTPEDEAIRNSLKPWEISTFPAYIMYPADPSEPPFLVSDSLLSQGQVIAALEKAASP